MHALCENPAADSLASLARRVRWKRWLGRLHRLLWLAALGYLLLYGVDCVFGVGTLGLRVALAAGGALCAVLFSLAALATWRLRLDQVGLAQVLEARHPELSERLVTLVQVSQGERSTPLGQALHAETERQLAALKPEQACTLGCQAKAWCVSVLLWAAIFGAFTFLPSFTQFSERLATAWIRPLVPYEIAVNGDRFALRGAECSITASVKVLDPFAPPVSECLLIAENEVGEKIELPMRAMPDGTFEITLSNLQEPWRYWAQAKEVRSEERSLGLVNLPEFARKPIVLALPPAYAKKNVPVVDLLGPGVGRDFTVLRYSKMYYHMPIDGFAGEAKLRVKRTDGPGERFHKVVWKPAGTVEAAADEVGAFEADLILELEHGLSATLPVGRYSVRDDRGPRLVQSLRLFGSDTGLRANHPYRVAPGAGLKVQAVVEDDEGLDAIALEYRINDAAPIKVERWLVAEDARQFAINHWLPLPGTLKENDRIQFRLFVSDNRRLKKGEIRGGVEPIPAVELMPHVLMAPAAGPEGDAWIEFRVEPSAEDLLKQYAQAQADEIRDLIGKIKEKVEREADQAKQLQRTIHAQAVLTPLQVQQAEKMQALDHEISQDLLQAGRKFSAHEELAKLAEHFFDIAEADMQKSAAALKQFREPGRSLADAERDLQNTQDALASARKKLERMLDLNRILAQDRLDRWQLEKLAKRQEELADRLAKALAELAPTDAERVKEIEAIRQEQAKLAEETEKSQEQNRLVQESAQAAEQKRLEHLAKEAEKIAAAQRVMRDGPPEKMPPEIKSRLDKLAERQADLAKRSIPFAKQNQGPDVQSAQAAADALKKPHLGEAIEQQKTHETRLFDWLGKLLPAIAVKNLRDEVAALGKMQKAIRHDLDRLGRDLPSLDEKKLQDRLRDLVARQRGLQAAIGRLAFDANNERLRAPQLSSQQSAGQAADRLAIKDALQAADAMEKAQQQLQALEALLPDTVAADRQAIKDATRRDRIETVEKIHADQKQLRDETEKLLADWMKESAGHGGAAALKEKTDKLSADLLELAQKGGPEAKMTAKESAQAVEDAKKAMDASQAMKAKGNVDDAKKLDDEASQKLEIAVKQLAKLAEGQAAKGMTKPDAEKMAEAVKQSAAQMRQAEEKLPKMPADAQIAMKSAAQKLKDAAQQANQQSARNLPNPARHPATQSSNRPGGKSSPPVSLDKLPALDGKAWGELPGALKTQMLQDFRTRYGPEYAEVIRQYFERLAQTPDRKE